MQIQRLQEVNEDRIVYIISVDGLDHVRALREEREEKHYKKPYESLSDSEMLQVLFRIAERKAL